VDQLADLVVFLLSKPFEPDIGAGRGLDRKPAK